MTTRRRTPAARRSVWTRPAAVVVLFLGVSCVGPGVAGAARFAVEQGVLTYTAEPAESNQLSIQQDGLLGGTVMVTDSVPMSVGSGCTRSVIGPEGPTLAPYYECFGVTSGVSIQLGDRDDLAEVGPPEGIPVRVLGGEGKDFISLTASAGPSLVDGGPGDDEVSGGAAGDVVRGGAGRDSVYGGPGDDSVEGGAGDDAVGGDFSLVTVAGETREDLQPAGADRVDGGPGDDRLLGGGGDDVLAGGPGRDTADYSARSAAVTVRVDGHAGSGQSDERDTVDMDVEVVFTGRGADAVWGGPGAETIESGAGDDFVDGGLGHDAIDAGTGLDRIDARDRQRDRIACGAERDRVLADRKDVVTSDCEVVRRARSASARR
jgi:hemolysin type calcium-binding protein